MLCSRIYISPYCAIHTNSFINLFLGYLIIDTNIEILSIPRHYFKMGHKTAEAACKIPEVEENDAIIDRTAQNGSNVLERG